jgi:hypothetical protein
MHFKPVCFTEYNAYAKADREEKEPVVQATAQATVHAVSRLAQ